MERRLRRAATLGLVACLAAGLAGCVTVSEFRKLEYKVNKMRAEQPPSGGVADLRAELDGLRQQMDQIQGSVDEARHDASQALEEAKAARLAAARPAPAGEGPEAAPAEGQAPQGSPDAAEAGKTGAADELRAYRAAYDAWRTDDNKACVDRFGQFLQTFPASQYADDAAYWLADCYYKLGDYKTAILRFDDVASRYPDSDKAAEALYRQGEALLQLGPGYGKAAAKAFQRVLDEHPKSKRARQAAQQLQLLKAG